MHVPSAKNLPHNPSAARLSRLLHLRKVVAESSETYEESEDTVNLGKAEDPVNNPLKKLLCQGRT